MLLLHRFWSIDVGSTKRKYTCSHLQYSNTPLTELWRCLFVSEGWPWITSHMYWNHKMEDDLYAHNLQTFHLCSLQETLQTWYKKMNMIVLHTPFIEISLLGWIFMMAILVVMIIFVSCTMTKHLFKYLLYHSTYHWRYYYHVSDPSALALQSPNIWTRACNIQTHRLRIFDVVYLSRHADPE